MRILWNSVWNNRRLLGMLIAQDIASSYRKTLLGMVWILLLPLLFIFVFTFVRLVLMGSRYKEWASAMEETVGLADVALAIFVGLIVFWMASECITRAAGVVASSGAYIKEMRFPLDILVISVVGVTLVHTAARIGLLLLGILIFGQGLPPTLPFLVVVVMPLLLGTVGISFLFAAVGAFIRDLQMVVGVAMTAFLFLSGVIFPLSRIPAPYDMWMNLNPIAVTIDQARNVTLWGQPPDWLTLAILMVIGLVVLQLGYSAFRRVQGRFADVA